MAWKGEGDRGTNIPQEYLKWVRFANPVRHFYPSTQRPFAESEAYHPLKISVASKSACFLRERKPLPYREAEASRRAKISAESKPTSLRRK